MQKSAAEAVMEVANIKIANNEDKIQGAIYTITSLV